MTDEQTSSAESLYRRLLELVGEDPDREGLARTPLRAAEALRFMTQGYGQDPGEILNSAVFEADYDEIVLVKDIEFYSLCEHHLMPFHGTCHIAYLPDGKIVGLSKIARLVDVFSRRFQVQEKMTREIAEAMQQALRPRGVAVVCDAQHFCMMMRGVQKQNSRVITSAVLGAFRTNRATRNELMDLLKIHRPE